jgi:predicted DNA-binding transcriptional regulator YafY
MRPTNQLISNLSKAISNNLIVSLSYSKPKNIAHIFEFSPHSLIKIRDTWYVRGYNKSSEHFEHFKCSLIEASAPFVSEQVKPSNETKQSDVLWHNTKQLKLSPHPLLKSENLAEIGSLMTDKSVFLEVREAILCEFSALYNLDGLQSICTCEKTDDYQLVCEVLS